ncbi:MAG: sn-glycerol-3-phosphate ABC transporter substrate-binding protein UgpB [Alphaproteobacteria bacterium]
MLLASGALLTLCATQAQAAVQIEWWHAMGGALGEKVEAIAAAFNASQSDYEVVAVYKGNYTETLNAAIAAFRAGEQPEIVQVFEVGTGSMMAAKGAVYPVYQLMADMGEPFESSGFLAAVTGYYTDPDGNMLSMPFNSSTPVLYYNKNVFEAAGIDGPPTTWPELAEDAQKIIDAGLAECGFTTAWQSWVQIENFSAWHNLPIGTLSNGFEGLGTEFTIDNAQVLRHLTNMHDWSKSGIFEYGGRRGDSQGLFTSGHCAMFFNSSAGRAGLLSSVEGFEFGTSMLPYYPDIEGAPQNSIIGGASLWVLAGNDDDQYPGVAKFFSYLSSAEVQADWHQFSGYLPITNAAYELTKSQGYYDANPGADVSISQMTLNPPTPNSKGLRFGNFVQIRDIFNEEMEAIWADQKTPEEALEAMITRGNELLRQFESDNG